MAKASTMLAAAMVGIGSDVFLSISVHNVVTFRNGGHPIVRGNMKKGIRDRTTAEEKKERKIGRKKRSE